MGQPLLPGLQSPPGAEGLGLPPCAQLWPSAQGLSQTGHLVFKASNYFQSAVLTKMVMGEGGCYWCLI